MKIKKKRIVSGITDRIRLLDVKCKCTANDPVIKSLKHQDEGDCQWSGITDKI